MLSGISHALKPSERRTAPKWLDVESLHGRSCHGDCQAGGIDVGTATPKVGLPLKTPLQPGSIMLKAKPRANVLV